MATTLNNPQGKILEIAIVPAMELQFGFETGAGLYTHDGDNLVISFEDGGKIILTDFYAQAPEELPEFLVEGDTKISSEQFLAQFNDESLLPAAGPAAGSAALASSGMNSYADDAGNLVTGVSRLSGLGNSQWSRSTTIGEGTEQNGVATTAAGAGTGADTGAGQINPSNPTDPTNPVDPTDPTDPTDPNLPKPDAGFPADVRFVMFRDPSDPDSAWEMTGVVKGATAIDNASLKYGTATIDAFGNVTYTLDPKYAGEHNPPLVDYIKYTGADGKEHSVQVVITTNPKFDDAAKESGNYNDIEGGILYEVQDGGQAGGNYNTSSSDKESATLDGSDFLTYNQLNGGTVNAGLGNDEITIKADMANNSTINAGTGSNTVTVGGSMNSNSTISALGDDSAGDKNTIVVKGGMLASTGETNLIESNAGTIDLNEAMVAFSGANTIEGGSSTIKIDGADYGMNAMNGGSNSVTTADTVTITTASGIGLGSIHGGVNTVTAKDVTVSAGWSGMSAYHGANTINADGKVDISANSEHQASGMEASARLGNSNAGTNTINAGGDVKIAATATGASGVAYGMSASTYSANVATNTINAGGDIAVAATATGASGVAYGMNASTDYSNGEASNTINADGNVTVAATATGAVGVAYGMNANVNTNGFNSEATNTITAGGDVTISATGTGSATASVVGMNATSGGVNTITAGADVKLNSTGKYATGVFGSGNGSENKITAAGDISIEATASSNQARGITADDKAINTIIAGGTLDITSKGGTGSWAVNAEHGGKNIIQMDSGNIKSTSNNDAKGIRADSGGTNEVISNTTLNISSDGKNTSVGVYATTGENQVKAANLDITASSSAGIARGVAADANGGKNIITSSELNITATGASSATGVYADAKGVNTITANDVTITATGATAYGMSATNSGTNTVQSAANSSLSATITGATAAMNAASGGSNTITGNSVAGTSGADADNITLNGNMTSSGTGKNTITTGAGNDTVTVNGGLVGAGNLISTGAGDDKIKVTGDVNGGTINAGTGSNSVTVDGFLHSNGTIKGSEHNDITVGKGMYGFANNVNTISSESGSITLNGAMAAAGDNSKNIIDGGASDVTLNKSMSATGTNAANTINTDAGNVNLNGAMSSIGNNSANSVTTGAGNVVLNSSMNSGNSGAVRSDGSTNTITTDSGNITIDTTGTNYTAMSARLSATEGEGAGNVNTLKSETGQIKISTGTGNALFAQGTGSKNVITTDHTSSSTDKTSADYYGVDIKSGHYAVYADLNKSENIIGHLNADGSVSAIAANVRIESGSAMDTLYASGVAKNTIKTTGNVDLISARDGMSGNNEITAKNIDIKAANTGMSSSNSIISNVLNATGNVDIVGTTSMGMTAVIGANAINAGGTVNVSGGNTGMYAMMGGKNTINADGSVSVSGGTTGMGANALGGVNGVGSNNSINTAGNVAVTGGITGMHAGAGGSNSVNAKDVSVSVVSSTGFANAVLASGVGSSNTIDASGNVKIEASSINEGSVGLNANTGGKNTVTAGGNVNITSGTYGVYADGVGSSNTINATNVNIVNAIGRGMHASNSASNDINTTVNTTIVGGPLAAGLHAESNGKNTITTGGDVNVVGGTIGMKALGGNSSINKIDAKGTVDVSATDAKSSALSAETGGTNIINAGVAANISGSQYGMYAATAGKNIIANTDAQGNVIAGMTGDVKVLGSIGMSANNANSQNIINTAGTVDVTSKDYAMHATAAGKNIISAGGATTIIGGNYGLYAASAGKNIIANTDAQGNVIAGMTGDVSVRGGTYGLSASSVGSENIINTTGDVKVQSATTGLSATSGASNSITAGDVNLIVSAGSNRATGLLASSAGSKNTINADGNVNIEASALGSSSLVYGLSATAGGSNTVDAEGKVEITSTALNGKAYGMVATGVNSVNTIDAAAVSINATGGTNSYAMYADGSGGKNTITATGNVDIDSTSGSAQSMGMFASGLGSSNTITATTGNVDIDATAKGASGTAFGLNASSGGTNTINAASVDVHATATGASGLAYGMKADTTWANVGSNTINTSGDVNITAEASNPANSYAMYTSGAGASNTINAAGAEHGVSITLTASTAMFTVGGGINTITGSSYNDTVTINGNISGTGNSINTGAGDDKLVLNGKIDSSFVFSAGEGKDTLVLTAANQAEFDSYYKAWLTNFFKSSQAKELEQISLNGTNPEDVKWLTDLVNNHNTNTPDNPITFVDSYGDPIVAEQPAGDEVDHSAAAAPMAFGFAPTSFKLSGSEVAEDNGFLNLQSTDSLATVHVVATGAAVAAPETAVVHEATAATHEAVVVEGSASVVSAHHSDYSEISGMLIPNAEGLHSEYADSISFEYVAHATGSDGTSILDLTQGHVLEGETFEAIDSGIITISAGNDSFSGSTGNDVFSWHAAANNVLNADGQGHNVGTIVDFSISGVLEGTFVDGQHGNDKIDLSALFSDGIQHLSVKSDGLGNAVIEVSASADAPVAQEIVLQGVYNNHSVSSGQEESFNQMILQHIITNNG